jgi:phosphosulfolactate synthase
MYGDLPVVEKTRTDCTMMIDRILPGLEEMLPVISPYISVAKIGWGIPLLLEDSFLKARVRSYRNYGVHVSNGGTLLEIASSRRKHLDLLQKLADTGFDTIELSEGVVDIPGLQKREIADFARSHGLRFHVEVGRKSPSNQLSLDETIDRINGAMDLDPDLVIIEGRETGRNVEIYDQEGKIKWDWVTRITEEYDISRLMFEAPLEDQQAQLIVRLGESVSLGNVSMHSVIPLESQRQGLRGDTFGAHLGPENVQGSPATRFVYHVIATGGPMDQSRIMRVTGLNRRTVQLSLDSLLGQGALRQVPDPHDMRRRLYSCEAQGH